jgi:hypothetical protein
VFNLDKRPITVAAQRWIRTSFHLYALASGLAGRLDLMILFMCRAAQVHHDYSTIRSAYACIEGDWHTDCY